MKKTSLSIVVPAYNEEENLEWFVKDILKTAPNMGFSRNNLEIIIINDGSTDKTTTIASKLTKQYKNVKAINKENNGYCQAVLLGIKEAKMKYVSYMPADGQTLLLDIVNCLQYLGNADLILGDRGRRLDYSLLRLMASSIKPSTA